MISQYFDLFVYIIKNLLLMLKDSHIEKFFGVSIMSCIVTFMCTMIVIRALIVPTGLGSSIVGFENTVKTKTSKSNVASSKGSKGD